jgi:hypothetical protein
MSAARDAVIADIHRLMASGQELRDQLLESWSGFAVGLDLLEQGTPLSEALTDLHTAERRVHMTERLAEFDECRHRLRISITAAGLEEGMSIGDIGRAFGVSRQLAARFAKEVRSQFELAEPPTTTAR